jgi:hypothetical protein
MPKFVLSFIISTLFTYENNTDLKPHVEQSNYIDYMNRIIKEAYTNYTLTYNTSDTYEIYLEPIKYVDDTTDEVEFIIEKSIKNITLYNSEEFEKID